MTTRKRSEPGRRLVAGHLDRHGLGIGEKAVVMALRVADGDFRDGDAAELSRAGIGTV